MSSESDEIIVLCAETGGFFDDIQAECGDCGKRIVHRPHIPQPAKLMCLECYLKIAKETDRFEVTEETIKDLKELFSAPRH